MKMTADSMHLAFEMELKPTGKRFIGDYRDIDIAVVNAINSAFDDVYCNVSQRSSDYYTFLNKPSNERVVLGQFDDVKDFVNALRRSQKRQSIKSTPDEVKTMIELGTKDRLPVINVSRDSSVDFSNTDRQINRHFGRAIDSVTGDVVGMIDAYPIEISYEVTLLAFDKISIDYLINSLASYFISMRSNTKFTAQQVMMNNSVYEVECAFVDTLGMSFDDASASIGERRLYASKAIVSVTADMLVQWQVVSEAVEYRLSVEGRMNG